MDGFSIWPFLGQISHILWIGWTSLCQSLRQLIVHTQIYPHFKNLVLNSFVLVMLNISNITVACKFACYCDHFLLYLCIYFKNEKIEKRKKKRKKFCQVLIIIIIYWFISITKKKARKDLYEPQTIRFLLENMRIYICYK